MARTVHHHAAQIVRLALEQAAAELRMPLDGISAVLGAVRSGSAGPLTATQRTQLDQAVAGADDLARRLAIMTDRARVADGRWILERSAVPADRLLDAIGAALASTGRVDVDTAAAPAPPVFCDARDCVRSIDLLGRHLRAAAGAADRVHLTCSVQDAGVTVHVLWTGVPTAEAACRDVTARSADVARCWHAAAPADAADVDLACMLCHLNLAGLTLDRRHDGLELRLALPVARPDAIVRRYRAAGPPMGGGPCAIVRCHPIDAVARRVLARQFDPFTLIMPGVAATESIVIAPTADADGLVDRLRVRCRETLAAAARPTFEVLDPEAALR